MPIRIEPFVYPNNPLWSGLIWAWAVALLHHWMHDMPLNSVIRICIGKQCNRERDMHAGRLHRALNERHGLKQNLVSEKRPKNGEKFVIHMLSHSNLSVTAVAAWLSNKITIGSVWDFFSFRCRGGSGGGSEASVGVDSEGAGAECCLRLKMKRHIKVMTSVSINLYVVRVRRDGPEGWRRQTWLFRAVLRAKWIKVLSMEFNLENTNEILTEAEAIAITHANRTTVENGYSARDDESCNVSPSIA